MNDKERWVMEWFEKGDHDLRAAEAIPYLEAWSADSAQLPLPL